MTTQDLSAWKQEGRLWVWQYANPRHDWRGWHLSGDRAGCRSIQRLLDLMEGGVPCHRTAMLSPVTDSMLKGIGFGNRSEQPRDRMRICFEPDALSVTINTQPERLVMTVGNKFLRKLVAGFTSVEIGDGDFGLRLSDDKKAEPFMFWWPPRD